MAYKIKVTMKNETITRIILVLEIAAIIVFHSLKSQTPVNENIARDFNDSRNAVQQTSQIVLTNASAQHR